MARRKKSGNLMTLLIVAVVAVFSAQYLGLFSIIPVAGLETEGTVDPLYVHSRLIKGWGSAASSEILAENVGPSFDFFDRGIGITRDYGQLKWFYKLEPISANQMRYTLIGIDMTLYGDANPLTCWAYPDATGQPAFIGIPIGYFFDKTVGIRENKYDHSITAYSFLTNDGREYNREQLPDFELKNNDDFGWKKVKHLQSSEMEGPGSYRTFLTWGPTAGIQQGAIPTVEEIDENFESYSPMGTTLTCGDVYAFKKEEVITYNPNDPTDIYLTLALDDNFKTTANYKTKYLQGTNYKYEGAIKLESDLGTERVDDLSKLYYSHFGPCGENIPARLDDKAFSTGPDASGYYSQPAKYILNYGYLLNGEIKENNIDKAIIGAAGEEGYILTKRVGFSTVNPISSGKIEPLYRSSPEYTEVQTLSVCVASGGQPTQCTPYSIDWSTVSVADELAPMNNVITFIEDVTPEQLFYFLGDREKVVSELRVTKLNESTKYSGVYSEIAGGTFVVQAGTPGTVSHPDMYFFTETQEYLDFKEMYDGTTCGFEIEEQADEPVQTVNSGYEPEVTGDSLPWGDWQQNENVTEPTYEGFDIWIFAIIGLILVGVYYFIIRR